MPEQTINDDLAELVARNYSSLSAPAVVSVLEFAFAVGAAVPVVDLLPGGESCLPLWTELCAALTPRGWHARVVYDDRDPRLVLLPEGATADDYDKCLCWWLTVEGYGNGTVLIHGGRPLPTDATDHLDQSWPTVAAVLEALDG